MSLLPATHRSRPGLPPQPRTDLRLRPAVLPPLMAGWSLTPRPDRQHSIDGLRLTGGDAATWLAHLAEQPPALQALAHFLLLPDGVLMVFPDGPTRPLRTRARQRPYHRLIAQGQRELWIPCDADLHPALQADQLARALFHAEDQWLCAEPTAYADIPAAFSPGEMGPTRRLDETPVRWLTGGSDALLRPARLLQLSAPATPSNQAQTANAAGALAAGTLLTHPMLAVRRTLQHSAEELLERGREDIATSLEQVPDATKGWLASLLDTLILGDRPDPIKRDSAAPVRASGRSGFGDKILQMLRAGGEPVPPGQRPGPVGEAQAQRGQHWLKAGLYSLMNLFSRKPPPPGSGGPMDAEAIRNFSLRQKLLEWWLERSPRARSELFGEQRNAIVQLLDEFEKGSIQDALRHALPLAPIHDPKTTRTVGIYDSAQLPENDINAPLSIDHTRRPAVAWMGGADLLEELRKNYSQAALQLIRQGRHQKAAYIYAMLLGDFWQAAHVLSQGGLHRESAQIYLEQLGDLRWAAMEFDAAGDLELAADLYLKLEDFDRAARVYENAGLQAKAHGVYRQQAKRLLDQHNFLAAGHVHAYKLQEIDAALEIFAQGLQQATGSVASELAVAALRCQLEQGRWQAAAELEARMFAGWVDNLNNLTHAQALTHFCGELAVLGKDLQADGPAAELQATWRNHVLIAAGRLAKLHQEAGRTGHLQRSLDPLQRLFHDDPACHADALRAQQARQKLRAGQRGRSSGGTRSNSPVRDFARVAGHAEVTCMAAARDSGMLAAGDREGAVWLFDPATQKLLSRAGIGAAATAIAVEAGGFYLAVLDAQKHLRIFQTDNARAELVPVSAFSIAGATCMAPQIVRDRVFIGTQSGSIVSYRLSDGLETGEPFILSDNGFQHLYMLGNPNRLLAVTASGLYTVLSYYDNQFQPLQSWSALPADADGERRLKGIAGSGDGSDLYLQLAAPGHAVLHYNVEFAQEPRRIDPPDNSPFGALGCMANGTPIVCHHGAPYRLAMRDDQPHALIPVEMTGMEPHWILPAPQVESFWMIDRAGNARLANLARPGK